MGSDAGVAGDDVLRSASTGVMEQYYGLLGRVFTNTLDNTGYLLRATLDEHGRVRTLHIVHPYTLVSQANITRSWRGQQVPSQWTVVHIDDLMMDVGL